MASSLKLPWGKCSNQCNQWVRREQGQRVSFSNHIHKNKTSFYVFFHILKHKTFSTLLVFGRVSFFYLSRGQRSVCSVNCPSQGGCRPRPHLQTPCGCSESPAPPPGSSAPWLGGCLSSATNPRADLCWEETKENVLSHWHGLNGLLDLWCVKLWLPEQHLNMTVIWLMIMTHGIFSFRLLWIWKQI